MDRLPKQNIKKEMLELNYSLVQMDLTNMYRTFKQTAEEYTLFSSAHRTFSRINCMLGHKQALVNLRQLKSHQAFFPTTMLRE